MDLLRRLWCRLFHEDAHCVVIWPQGPNGHRYQVLRFQCVRCDRCWKAWELERTLSGKKP